LEVQLDRAVFNTWLRGADVATYEDGEFSIRVRHAYAKDWIEKHLGHVITYTLGSIFGRSVHIHYVVATTTQPEEPEAGPLWAVEYGQESDDTQEEEPEYYPAWEESPAEATRADLNRRYTFDTFVVGPSNEFAYAAARAVADNAGCDYNPLFIYGGVGLGKTHLLQAIGHYAEEAGSHVICISGEAFTNELVTAIRSNKTADFRARYRRADVLLVDDVQFIAGKTAMEEEFYHTFNTIINRGGQVVITSDRLPRDMKKLDERLRSRFEGGLQADIQIPELETRIAILEVKSSAQGTPLPENVALMLAEHVTTSVRELEGIMTQVLARASLAKQPLTEKLVESILARTGIQAPRRTASVDEVLEATATYHQMSLDDLISKRRNKEVVRARHIAIYLAREATSATLPQIGDALGGRDHSTVLHGYQKIADDLNADPILRREVNDIRRQLNLLN
jgi:chromosomal replication initiator protein